jgi:hypothetical protein
MTSRRVGSGTWGLRNAAAAMVLAASTSGQGHLWRFLRDSDCVRGHRDAARLGRDDVTVGGHLVGRRLGPDANPPSQLASASTSFVRSLRSLSPLGREAEERPTGRTNACPGRTGKAGSDQRRRGDRGAPPFGHPPTAQTLVDAALAHSEVASCGTTHRASVPLVTKRERFTL